MNNPVERPAHYTFGKIEVLEAITDWQLNFSRGSAVKYLVRAGRKDPATEIQDLKKAAYFIAREIERLEKRQAAAEANEITVFEALHNLAKWGL